MTYKASTFRGPYTLNQWYSRGDQVEEHGYLMQANRTTQEYPAPVPQGLPTWAVQGLESFSTLQQLSPILAGVRVEVNEYLMVTEYAVYIPDQALTYEFYVRNAGNGKIITSAVLPSPQPALGWTTVLAPGGDDLWIPGDVVDIAYYYSATQTAGSFNHVWNFSGIEIGGNPGTGNFGRAADYTTVQIHKTDNGGTDRSADLLALQVGDNIDIVGEQPSRFEDYTIDRVTDEGAFVDYGVHLTSIGGSLRHNKLCTITGHYSAAPVNADYVVDTNFWIRHPTVNTVNGFIVQSPDDIPTSLDNHAYGVDVKAVEFTSSDHWDYMSSSGS